jgi:transcription termination/antitermination protein NusG
MHNKQECDDWYALFVATGKEDNVKERLQYRMQEKMRILVPKRKLKERKNGIWTYNIRTLFPGYVLLNGEVGVEEYYNMKNIPDLIKLIRSGYEPLKIEYDELELISKLICNDETIGFSNVLIENGRVVVVDGPLVSMEGYILSIDRRKGRAKVRLSFLGEERTVELGINVLQPG